MGPYHRSLLITVLVLLLVSSGTSQSIRIGKTIARVGASAPYSLAQEQGYEMFSEAAGPELQLGDVLYKLEHVEYNDAGDPELIEILYERLVDVDQVDFLFAPLSSATGPVLALANERQIPLINGALFDIYAYPKYAGNWSVTTLPDVTALAPACAIDLMKAGARTYVLIEDELLSSTIYVSDLVLEGMGLRRLMNSTVLRDGIDFEDARLVDSVIEQWMKLRPDIVAIGASPSDTDLLMERIRRKRYEPPSIFIILGAETRFRQGADARAWLDSGAVIPAEFEASLNFSDALFNSSGDYAIRLRERFNASAGLDVSFAIGGTVLIQALKAAGTKDQATVMAKMRAFNESTIAGQLSFNPVNGLPVRNLYCLQFAADASRVSAVAPQSLPSIVPLVYPAPAVPYTKDYLPHSNKKKLEKILLPIGLGLVVLVVAGVILFLVFRQRFYIVFVARDVQAEEWN